jgi:hypothetical protein
MLIIDRADEPHRSGGRGRLGTQRYQEKSNDLVIASLGKGSTIRDDGLFRSVQTFEDPGATKPRIGQVGRFAISREGIVVALGLVEHIAETKPRLGVVGLEGEGSLVTRRSFAESTLLSQDIAEAVVCLWMVRVDGRMNVLRGCGSVALPFRLGPLAPSARIRPPSPADSLAVVRVENGHRDCFPRFFDHASEGVV